MRRIGMLLLILLLLCGCAYAQEPEPETEVVTDGLSDEARELLPTEHAGTVDLWDGAKTVLTGALARAFGGWHEALRLCALLLAVLTFCALLQWQKEPPAALVVVGALGITGATVASMQSMVQLAAGTIEELSSYGTCMLPVLASATAMSGGVSSSTALYGGAVLFSQLLTRAISKLLIPGVWLFLAVATAEAALGNQMLTELRKLIGWLISKGLRLFVPHRRHHRVGRRLGGQNDEGGGLRHGAGRRRHDLRCVGDAAGKCGCVEKFRGRVRDAGRSGNRTDAVPAGRSALSAAQAHDGGRRRGGAQAARHAS